MHKPDIQEKTIVMGNRVKSPVKAIGTYRLLLFTRFLLDLHNTFHVPNVTKNLVFIHQLDLEEYSFDIRNSSFIIYKNNILIGNIWNIV